MVGHPVLPASLARLLYLRNDDRGRTLTHAEFRKAYGFEPGGVNCYYGVNNAAVAHWQMTGAALRPHHRSLLDDVSAALAAGDRPTKTLNLGLWPYQPPEPYGFIANHLSLLRTLATELHDYQRRAHEQSRTLDVVVRYASEMNDPAKPSQPWGRAKSPDPEQQVAYRDTFAQVRALFRDQAPSVRFAFSPAIRADIRDERYAMIPSYWPGDECVDVVSCTWYVGRETDLAAAVERLKTYFREFAPRKKAFGIDELGGIFEDRDNDRMLQRMFLALEGLAADGVRLDYASLFLQSKWGKDATLGFLRGT
jgi:hypothetical protein